MSSLVPQPLAARAFAPFGEVIEPVGAPDKMINQGRCGRFHDLAGLDFDADGRAGISLFVSEPVSLPLRLEMMERHPLGSQAFLPMAPEPYLIVVAPDDAGQPGRPLAFLAAPGQGVNYHRNTWHGVLMPLDRAATFAVVDRIGSGDNLQEHWFDEPYTIGE